MILLLGQLVIVVLSPSHGTCSLGAQRLCVFLAAVAAEACQTGQDVCPERFFDFEGDLGFPALAVLPLSNDSHRNSVSRWDVARAEVLLVVVLDSETGRKTKLQPDEAANPDISRVKLPTEGGGFVRGRKYITVQQLPRE